jgi:hypothetical protein
MKLIKNWQQAWKLHSVQMAVVLIVANALIGFLPALEGQITPWVYALLNSIGGALIAALRVIQQVDFNGE